MTEQSFEALASLIRLRASAQREAARLVLVGGMRPSDAARAAGVTPSAVGNTLRACRAGIALAKKVARNDP